MKHQSRSIGTLPIRSPKLEYALASTIDAMRAFYVYGDEEQGRAKLRRASEELLAAAKEHRGAPVAEGEPSRTAAPAPPPGYAPVQFACQRRPYGGGSCRGLWEDGAGNLYCCANQP